MVKSDRAMLLEMPDMITNKLYYVNGNSWQALLLYRLRIRVTVHYGHLGAMVYIHCQRTAGMNQESRQEALLPISLEIRQVH